VGLLVGLVDRNAYQFVVVFSAAHALLFLVLFAFRLEPFPVQVRIAYFLWVLVGTYVPHMTILMYITTVGLLGNLFFRYCPLARMIHLLPWNRRAFLRDVLKLPSVDVGEGWLIFGLPPAEVAVHPSDSNDVHRFYLMCDDINVFVAAMGAGTQRRGEHAGTNLGRAHRPGIRLRGGRSRGGFQ
jgi:hypothetical protein